VDTVRRKGGATAETKLRRLHAEQGQSPWLDNLNRPMLRDGHFQSLIDRGVRGVTGNPTIFAKAIEGSDAYDAPFGALIGSGCSVVDAYWHLVREDMTLACQLLLPVFEASNGSDGFASVEVAPELAHDSFATVSAARELHERIAQRNLLVKIPATAEGIPAIQAVIAEGRSVNVTLIFSLERYQQVIQAYLSGLESWADGGGDLSAVHSVASFFVSRVDTEVDSRLELAGTARARKLLGCGAVAQAKLAYRLFLQSFSGPRWEALAKRGAEVQRPLWASTSTKNPAYSDTMYVDSLIGPDTVNTMPEATMDAFEDHGNLVRTVDTDVERAARVIAELGDVGVDLGDVGTTLEVEGVAAFHESFAHVLAALQNKAARVPHGSRPG
jgi:transaldolase